VYVSLWGIYVSLVGISVSLGVKEPSDEGLLNQNRFIMFLVGFIMLGALISSWRIFAWVLTNGPKWGKHISPIWWVLAALGASLTVLTLLDFQELLYCPHGAIGAIAFACMFEFGKFFLIPVPHLIIEVVWQKRTYKTL
jgi:hypothetical protein